MPRAAPDLQQAPRGTAPQPQLTTAEAGDPQGLGCVQRQAALHVLNVGHGGHGVKVGLQWQLPLVPAGLDLPRERGQQMEVAPMVAGARWQGTVPPWAAAVPPQAVGYLEAIEVCEEGVIALDVSAEAQGQLLVDVVTDVNQARHIQGQALHPCGQAVRGWASQAALPSTPGPATFLAQPRTVSPGTL